MQITDIYEIINNIEYGWVDKNGENHIKLEPALFYGNYQLQTPTELLESKIGVCWDQVELERYYLEKINIIHHAYDIIYVNKNNMPNHTFLVYEENNSYFWFEHAWDKYKGIHKYNSLKELLNDVKEKFIVDELKNNCDINYLNIFEYDKLKVHSGCEECYSQFTSGKNISSIIKE